MGRAIKLGAALIGATGLFASIAFAAKVDPSTAAKFFVEKGYGQAKLLGGSRQMFVIQPQIGSCKKLKWVTGVNWADKAEKMVLVPVGTSINLYAQTKINSDGGWMQTISNKCAASVTFTPQIGASYTVVQHAKPPEPCHLNIVDRATGAPPPDLMVNAGAPLCGGYM